MGSAEETVKAALSRRDGAVERHQSMVERERTAERERAAATDALERAQEALIEAKRRMETTEEERDRLSSDVD